ncbi:MAG: YpdA family putative bacillithiol disulfide reductase [Planctomycetota bacterium]
MPHPSSDLLDVLIVGAGPAGLAVANACAREGLHYLACDQGPVANHIAQFPTFMRFFSTRDLLEIDGFPLTIVEDKPTRQEYIAYLARFARDRHLRIRSYTRVEQVERRNGEFVAQLKPQTGPAETLRARHLVVACGGFENPRRLNVPGEELPKVSHRFSEVHPYVGSRVLVVGGRNSAVEAALALYRGGAQVALANRRAEFGGRDLKYWLKPDIENRIARKEIDGYMASQVARIDPAAVTLRRADGSSFSIANDFVIVLIGYDPPVAFLRSLGVELAEGTNVPRHDPGTLETNVPGLFVAGTIVAGNVSGHVFIENSRGHGDQIVHRVLETRAAAR